MSINQAIAFDPLSYENLGQSISRALDARPIVPLAELTAFQGVGIYSLYYSGDFPLYSLISAQNRIDPGTFSIYIGRAEAENSRKGEVDQRTIANDTRLYSRITNHRASIGQASNISIDDFSVRYLVVAPTWVSLAEVVSIRQHTPLWNTVLSGLGNHAPGRGRSQMVRPLWDTVHPGRPWASNLKDNPLGLPEIEQQIHEYLERVTQENELGVPDASFPSQVTFDLVENDR